MHLIQTSLHSNIALKHKKNNSHNSGKIWNEKTLNTKIFSISIVPSYIWTCLGSGLKSNSLDFQSWNLNRNRQQIHQLLNNNSGPWSCYSGVRHHPKSKNKVKKHWKKIPHGSSPQCHGEASVLEKGRFISHQQALFPPA